jgi:hypothetical protein
LATISGYKFNGFLTSDCIGFWQHDAHQRGDAYKPLTLCLISGGVRIIKKRPNPAEISIFRA